MLKIHIVLLTFAVMGLGVNPLRADSDDPEAMFQTYCFGCHGPERQEAELRIDTLAKPSGRTPVDAQARGQWFSIASMIESGDMPPEDQPRPSPKERNSIRGKSPVGRCGD